MTRKGEEICAFWRAMCAVYVVLGGMTPGRAQRRALKDAIDAYGEEAIAKELGIEAESIR